MTGAAHESPPGWRKIAVKVVDIFGNDTMKIMNIIINAICTAHATTQAIYLYGTRGTEYQRPDSDIAVLLPQEMAKTVDNRKWHLLAISIAHKIHVEHVNLTNLRCVNLPFQFEILRTGKLIHCADEDSRIGFESRVLSMYQDWNYRRTKTQPPFGVAVVF